MKRLFINTLFVVVLINGLVFAPEIVAAAQQLQFSTTKTIELAHVDEKDQHTLILKDGTHSICWEDLDYSRPYLTFPETYPVKRSCMKMQDLRAAWNAFHGEYQGYYSLSQNVTPLK